MASTLFRRFGQEKGAAPGPHAATTTVGENVRLRIHAGGIKVRTPLGLQTQNQTC